MSDADDVLGSFYGERREWTVPERAASRALVEQHGWTAARAGYVADWIENNPEGRFWRQHLTAKDGIAAVLKSVVTITEKSDASKHAAARVAPEAYQPYSHPDVPSGAKQIVTSRAARVAEVQRPWLDLIDEAHARGLKGPAMSRWVFKQRAAAMGYEPIDPLGMLAGMGVGEKPMIQPPSKRGSVEPQRVADPHAPKSAVPEPDYSEPAEEGA